MMSILFTSVCVSSAAAFLLLVSKWTKRSRYYLPPGPKGYPFIGTPSEFPPDHTWLHVAKHKDLYGPISSITVLGQTIVLLNDVQTARDLLEKKSAIYSDRPTFIFADMCGCGNLITLNDAGPLHTAYRRSIQQSFGSTNSIFRLSPLVEIETRRFLARILSAPSELEPHAKVFAAAIILKATYGYSVATDHLDPLVDEVEESLRIFTLSIQPAAWLVDALPALRRMPNWVPGMTFKRTAATWRKQFLQAVERPYLFVKQQMAAGDASPSHISALLQQSSDAPDEYQEHVYKWSAATMYGAGSDTTLSLVYSFFLALVLFPEVQKKAQVEIDEIIGPDRLPTLSDREDLPYVEAVFKEVLRWHSNVPMGIPHVLREDDRYRGYIIPKGSVLMPNSWLFAHDPCNYRDPFAFKPERFLAVNGFEPEMDPATFVFGFGRRICLGKKLAESSIFHVVAMTLATLSVGKALDTNGVEITPVLQVTAGLLCHPKPFQCSITARSEKAREVILSIYNEDDIGHNDAAAMQAISVNV